MRRLAPNGILIALIGAFLATLPSLAQAPDWEHDRPRTLIPPGAVAWLPGRPRLWALAAIDLPLPDTFVTVIKR